MALVIVGSLVAVAFGVAFIESYKFDWFVETPMLILLAIAGITVLSNCLKRATKRG